MPDAPWWIEGYEVFRPLDDGRWLTLVPLTYGRGRIGLWTATGASLDQW